MFTPIRGISAIKASSTVGRWIQVRGLATVQTTPPPSARTAPVTRPHGTPISRERATLTIRDGPIFHGKSFGAKANISGECKFLNLFSTVGQSLTKLQAFLQLHLSDTQNLSQIHPIEVRFWSLPSL
jgi:hypothetical protein